MTLHHLMSTLCLLVCWPMTPAVSVNTTGQTPPADRQERADQEKTVDGIQLTSKSLLDGKLTLLVPKGFQIMDEEMLRIKYPNRNRPTLVYTNEPGSINVAINHTANRITMDQLAEAHQQMERAFRQNFPSAKWYQSGLIEIQGRKWMTLNVQTPALDTKIRNIVAGTSLDDRFLLVTFNVTEELEEKWLKAAEAVIQSIRISK